MGRRRAEHPNCPLRKYLTSGIGIRCQGWTIGAPQRWALAWLNGTVGAVREAKQAPLGSRRYTARGGTVSGVLVDGLVIPALLVDLIAGGVWPADLDQAFAFERAHADRRGEEDDVRHLVELGAMAWEDHRKNVEIRSVPVVTLDRIQAVAPNEHALAFSPPPFKTIAHEGGDFWGREEAAPAELEPEKAILIGDFGRGSDAPIVMDYCLDADDPRVRYLRWGRKSDGSRDNHWVTAGRTFEEFARKLGLVEGTGE